tara:strand:+ start:825 stop:1550 length:726 start_codon:yes stop_codon:yes gene_type:complete
MKKIVIYGGTSLISIELIKKFSEETDEFLVISRNNLKLKEKINEIDSNIIKKIKLIQIDLLDLEKNIEFINNLNDHFYDGIIFVIGETGDPDLEFENYNKCLENYKINLLHPVIVLNTFVKKLKKNSFICVFTSMAGIRGRALRLFYCSAKSGLISYLSGLRQKLQKENIQVTNVIAGYMKTEKFKYNVNKFLISSPNKVAKIVHKGIINKKDNIYTSYLWFLISIILKIIPEKIFKRFNF